MQVLCKNNVLIGSIAGVALTLSGCGTADDSAPSSTQPVTSAQATPTTTTPNSPEPTVPPPSPDKPTTWTMPDLVGKNLQDAQDAVQALTDNAVFLTASHDATGQNRNQIVDSNWKVCSQNIAPGSTIKADAHIDFGAVKLYENCP